MSGRTHLIRFIVLGLMIFAAFSAASYSVYSVSQNQDENRDALCQVVNDGRDNDRFFYQALLDARDLEENPLTEKEEKLVAELFARTELFDCEEYVRTGRFPK